MATNFPTSIDNFDRLVDNTDTIIAAHINNIQDAIEALEAKVGVDSDTTESLDFKVANFFVNGRKVWFFENTPPTNWVTVSTTADCILGLKGGSYFTTGGAKYTSGTWTISGYSTDTHNHAWYYESGSSTYTYNTAGTGAKAMTTSGGSGEGRQGLVIEIFNDFCVGNFEHCDSSDGGVMYVNNDSHSHTHGGWDRPPGAMGIIAEFDIS